jgi:glycosyltransferase involved in cell wall biosynthesis
MRRSTDELCHVNLARGFRGGERQTELLIRALADAVPRQRLVALEGGRLLERLRGVDGLAVSAVRGRLDAVAATAGAGVVHAHETHGAQTALARNLLSGTRFLITRRVATVPSSSPITRLMYRRADRVVAVSRAIERVTTKFEPSIRTAMIPDAASGLPFDVRRVEAYRTAWAGKFVVGHVAAYDFNHKGQDVLLAAATLLRHAHPEIEFVFVGSGPDEALLRTRAAPLDNVTVTGWTDNVGDYLAAFDLFAFPSIHEGLGSILLDAMEFGLPIVASDVDGIPEVVLNGQNGLLVPPREPRALADAIARLVGDRALRAAIAAANKLRAHEFSAAKMAARYLELYAELSPALAAARPSTGAAGSTQHEQA